MMTKHDKHQADRKSQKNKDSKREWQTKIIVRAWKDPHFKERLIADPKSALNELHCPVPEKLKVKAIEEHESQWVLVIPKKPSDASKLSNTELSSVAGGAFDLPD